MPSWKKLITSGSDAAIPSISHTGDFTLDVSGDISIDADGADILLKDGGTSFGRFKRDNSNFVIKSETSNKDLVFKGTAASGVITALTLGGKKWTIHDIDSINTSFPNFISLLKNLGAKIHW